MAQARVGGVAVRAALLADLEPLLDAVLACNKLNAQHGLVSGLGHFTFTLAIVINRGGTGAAVYIMLGVILV